MRNNLSPDTFTSYILDQLASMGCIKYKRMFSSYGIYINDNFCGLTNDGHFYLKTNKLTRIKYQQAGMKPFSPSIKQILKNYFEVPIDVIEDFSILTIWVRESMSI